MSARGKTAIAGFYEIPTEKELPGRSTYSVLAEVARGAIADAGLRPQDIDGLIGQEGLNSMTLAEVLGLKPRYTASMSVHGASGATSIATAPMAITPPPPDSLPSIFGQSPPPRTPQPPPPGRTPGAPQTPPSSPSAARSRRPPVTSRPPSSRS